MVRESLEDFPSPPAPLNYSAGSCCGLVFQPIGMHPFSFPACVRRMGFEPMTSSFGGKRSATELTARVLKRDSFMGIKASVNGLADAPNLFNNSILPQVLAICQAP